MEQLTNDQRGILAVVELNKKLPRKEITIKREIGPLAVTLNWRSKKNLWGRFGGGWNWKLGVQGAKGTVIVYLLVCSLRFDIKK